MGYVVQQYFSYIMAVSFIGGGNRVPGEKQWPVTSHWQTLSHNVVSNTIMYISPWMGFEHTILVVIGTDCTGSCKSNYHMISTMTAPVNNRSCTRRSI